MKLFTQQLAASLVILFMAMGCAGGGTPTSPLSDPGVTNGQGIVSGPQTHLWGYYDVYIDIPTQTATAVENRSAMFAANVVQFVNNPVSNLSFAIQGTPVGTGYVDVDINVSIKHPFSGLTQYNGYDVRGIFIGNASQTMKYDTDLKYAAHEGTTDQEMYDYAATPSDPGVYGNPDGYTRWFNPPEFGTTGLFGYTKGVIASAGYKGTATLNPYKYFADGLAISDDAYTFMTTSPNHGVFAAGNTNTRNYYLRFPNTPGIKFNYAIVANWIDETTHPANAPEACAIKATLTPDIYYISGTNKGGKLKVDINFPNQWSMTPSTVYLESTVLNTPYHFTSSDMVPTGSGAGYSTYHAEVTADNITGNSNTVKSEYWVIAQYDGFDYTNTFGVPNTANTDKLAAFFRSDLYVSPTAYNMAPVIDSGISGNDSPLIVASEVYTVTAHDPDGDPLTYSWTVSDHTTHVAKSGYNDVPGDGAGHLTIDWGDIGAIDGHQYDVDCVVSDGKGGDTDAAQLVCTGSATIWEYDGSIDDGGMSTINDVGINWKYDSANKVWDENGDVNTYDINPVCTTLLTPKFDIPSGGNVKIDLVHSGQTTSWYSAYVSAAGMIGYTLDGGANVDYNNVTCPGSTVWLNYESGENFNFPYQYWTAFFGGWYNYSCMYCDEWSIQWTNRIFGGTTWGSLTSPVTSTWQAYEIGGQNNVQLVFFWDQGSPFFGTESGTGWQLDKIRVYLAP